MATLQDIVHIGQSGLTAQQQLMSTVSQNLANLGTKGYHRRTTVLGTGPGQSASLYTTNKFSNSSGVTVLQVVRTYNAAQEAMLRTEQSNVQYHTRKGAALTDLQSLLSGTSADSFDTRLQSFWNSWQAVANNPADLSARNALLENGASLAATFQDLGGRLADYRSSLASLDGTGTPTGIIPDVVAQINSLASQIQDLNRRITLAGPNAKTLDLQDERERLFGELAKSVDITIATDGTVTLDGNVTLVSGDGLTCNTLSITSTTGPITFDLNGTAVTPRSGDLAAWTDAATAVETASANVDLLANTLMTGVNNLHASGFDLDGNAAVAFFTGTDTDSDGLINASTLAMNTALYDPSNPGNDNPRAIAAAATRVGPGVPNAADSQIALQMAALASSTFAALNNETLSVQFNSQLSKLGAAINNAKQDATNATYVAQMLSNTIQQESGVNSDEEMVNMITSQRAYQAAAKVVSISNEMMDTVLKMI